MTTPKANTPPFKKKMVITEQSELARWTANNEEKVIFEIQAVNEQGQSINRKLRTFHPELPQGELIEFEVSEYIHETYGQTFTLKLPSKGRASKKDLTALQSQFSGLANRVGALEGEVAELRAEIARGKPLDSAKEKAADERFGEEAPWP